VGLIKTAPTMTVTEFMEIQEAAKTKQLLMKMPKATNTRSILAI